MKRPLSLLLLLCMILSLFAVNASAATDPASPTGYTSSADVEYVTGEITADGRSISAVANWGARGENCVFLTTYATDYYTDSYSYDTLSALDGGTGTSDAYSSPLYKALQSMMKAEHTYINSYNANNVLFAYTDCIRSDTSMLSSFYSGTMVGSAWVSGGKTYNKEHTWPNSKGLNGSDEDDIMMIRPTVTSENSSRGNKSYGESSGYYDPNSLGMDVRGDCARIFLYTYVRWGNVNGNSKYGTVWGTNGVIENLDILLKWMEEDPVDTWEMGRNDAVESITGVRNVFVDYPEYAWLLFGEEIPTDMVTPSGEAKNSTATTVCTHTATEIRGAKEATCTAEGYTGDTYCIACGAKLSSGDVTPKSAHTEQTANAKDATCAEAGYTGDTVCTLCGETLATGTAIAATGEHSWSEWTVTEEATESKSGTQQRVCSVCGETESASIPVLDIPATEATEPAEDTPAEPPAPTNWTAIILIAVGCCVLLGGGIVIFIVLKKRRH